MTRRKLRPIRVGPYRTRSSPGGARPYGPGARWCRDQEERVLTVMSEVSVGSAQEEAWRAEPVELESVQEEHLELQEGPVAQEDQARPGAYGPGAGRTFR
ncbi:hypothetical protein AVEN_97144-1 [Araneus ventricosus]|uniref:Uncharacterized protein n=1 Tax=Araneus ventricosus TaxID=182803 RepID=A0A4Y2DF02_ARAVE|nr:hypothetical protein AVEN_97144-1 [Araneus ventricosus]